MRPAFTGPSDSFVGQEALTVQCRGGVPVLFRRPARTRGSVILRDPRWYRVRAVVASWSEAAPWWRALTSASRDRASAEGTSAEGASAEGPRDRRVWRVEARPAREPITVEGGDRVRGIDVFDLVEHPDGRWLLLRAHD